MIKIQFLRSLALFLSFLLSNLIMAQEVEIRGRVINQAQEPLLKCEISMYDLNNNLVRATVNDSLGVFQFNVEKGKYILEVKRFGISIYSKEITVDKKEDIGTIQGNEFIVLEEINLESRKNLIERKLDRLVYNVENSIVASGGSVLDILNVIPGVLVQSNSITLIGKSNLKLMIDGNIKKLSGESLISYLRALNSNNIESIEIITNPPAKYSAEGNSGIINIILKKQSIDNWKNSLSSSYSQSKNASFDLYDNFTYKKDKLTVGTELSYINPIMRAKINKNIFYPQQEYKEENIMRTEVTYIIPQASLSYEISKKLIMGTQYEYFFNDSDRDGIRSGFFSNSNNSLDSLAINNSIIVDRSSYHALNYYIGYTIDSIRKRNLRFDFDLFDFTVNQISNNNNQSYLASGDKIEGIKYILNSDNVQNNKDYSFKLDFIYPIGEYEFNYGANLSFLKVYNKIEYFDQISELIIQEGGKPNKFRYNENTQGIYFSMSRGFKDKWKAKTGLRVESSQIESNATAYSGSVKEEYIELFPTAYISYEPHEKHYFSLNYGRRIDRPNFMMLNPFKTYTSAYSHMEGNPFLKPSFSSNLEFNYMFNQRLHFNVYYNNISRSFDYLSFVDSVNLSSFEKPENYLKKEVYGLILSYNHSPTVYLDLFSTINYNYSSSSSYIPELLYSLKGNNSYFNINTRFHIKKNLGLNINYYHYFYGVNGLEKTANRNYLDISLRAKLLKDKIDLLISSKDIFNTNRFRSYTYSNGIRINTDVFVENSFRISLNYTFGNKGMEKQQYSGNKNQDRM